MKDKTKKSALAFAALKSGQQILHDLDSVVLNNSAADIARYGTEQICRLGSAGIAAYTIDKAVSYFEELALPKYLRGALPLAAATIGTGVLINYFGDFFNMPEGLGILETTKQLVNNYQHSLTKLVTFDSSAHAGHLTGAAIAIKSGARLLKNIGESIAYKAEEKKQKEKDNSELRESNEIPKGL